MSNEENVQEEQGFTSIIAFYEKNKNNLMIAGIALIVVAGGLYYYTSEYLPERENEAANGLYQAEKYMKMDSTNLALNGDGVNMGLIEVADDYSSTKVGAQAAYFAGRLLMDEGKYDEALEYLNDADLGGKIMPAMLLTLKGDCLSELEKFEEAGDMYAKAAKVETNDLSTPYALMKAGMAYEEAGELGDALKAYKRLSNDFSSTQFAQNAKASIARATALQAAQ